MEELASIHDWKFKYQFLLLIYKFTTVRHGNDYRVQAVLNFKKVWRKLINYWNENRPQDNLEQKFLDIL